MSLDAEVTARLDCAERALTDVLTLSEGLTQVELLGSRFTRREVESRLSTAADALEHLRRGGLDARWPELAFEVWAEARETLTASHAPGVDGVLWSLVHVHAASTVGWIRLHRANETVGERASRAHEAHVNDGPIPVSIATFLADHGYDGTALTQAGAHGLTPLMRAALEARLDVVEALLERRVDVATMNDDGNTALWLACVGGDADVVRALAHAGADLDHANVTGATALMYAASAGKAAMVALLLELGANPWTENQDGTRAVEMAATLGCLEALRFTAR